MTSLPAALQERESARVIRFLESATRWRVVGFDSSQRRLQDGQGLIDLGNYT
jgi:hypothetical protein